MKILHVVPSLAPAFGGPTNAVLNLSAALARKGEEITIFTTDADIKKRLNVPLGRKVDIAEHLRVAYFPVQYLHKFKFSMPFMSAVRREIGSFDAVHIHSLFQFPSLITAWCCQELRTPYIIRPLGQLDPLLLKRHSLLKNLYLKFFEEKNLRMAYALHFTTEMEKEWSREANFNPRAFVIPLGVDPREFTDLPARMTFRSRYQQIGNGKIILFLGRIDFKKGLDILIEAFAMLSGERKDLWLVIAGPDNEGFGQKVRRWAEEKGVSDRVIFTGMLLGREKLAAYRDSDLFALPSYSENFGISVVEAMGCLLPVVISDKVGIHEEVRNGKAGLVASCDGRSFYAAMKTILENGPIREEIARNGKRLADDYYNIDRIADRMIDIYDKMTCGGT